METIAISKFKATCLAVVKRVKRTGKPIRITKFGQPVAEIVPPTVDAPMKIRLGCMAGTGEVRGDIVGPIGDPDDWEALRD